MDVSDVGIVLLFVPNNLVRRWFWIHSRILNLLQRSLMGSSLNVTVERRGQRGHKRQRCSLFCWCQAGVWLYESRWFYYACLLSQHAAQCTSPCQHACVLMCVFTGPSGRRCTVTYCSKAGFFAHVSALIFCGLSLCFFVIAYLKERKRSL